MSVQLFILRPDQHGPALNVVGTEVTVLASNEATKSYGITLQQGEEGTGPPPHSHDWDEAFYVLKGEIHFLCDGKPTPAPWGRSCTFPEEPCMAFATDEVVGRCWRLLEPAR